MPYMTIDLEYFDEYLYYLQRIIIDVLFDVIDSDDNAEFESYANLVAHSTTATPPPY